jgi:hypothetical protein
MKRLLLVRMSVFLMLAAAVLSGCQVKPNPTSTGQRPDDIVLTPGGPAYRANVIQQGKTNPWPPIPVETVKLTDNISIEYRAVIDMPHGTTTNDLIFLYVGPASQMTDNFTLSFVGLSPRVDIQEKLGGVGRPGVLYKELQVANLALPGFNSSTFQIRAEYQGKDLGEVPCTVNILWDDQR